MDKNNDIQYELLWFSLRSKMFGVFGEFIRGKKAKDIDECTKLIQLLNEGVLDVLKAYKKSDIESRLPPPI